MPRLRGILALAGLGWLVGSYWARKHPSAFPYAGRFLLEAPPRRALAVSRLMAILDPHAGERILELGPGTGYYSLDVASALGSGALDVFDIQQEYLDHVLREAAAKGIENVEASRGDASSLPYENDSFDAAFLVSVLGEIPDQDACLRELARVLRPGGRLVVGESVFGGDPHVVLWSNLRERAERAGFACERREGSPLAYFARFSGSSSTRASAS